LNFTKRLRIFLIVLCHVVYLVNGIPKTVISQESFDGIVDKLVTKGFENISVVQNQDTLLVFYENRKYRFEPRGMAELTEIVVNDYDRTWSILSLVLLTEKVPMLTVSFSYQSFINYSNSAISDDEFYNLITASFDVARFHTLGYRVYNTSNFKIDLPVIPTWSAKFGNFDNPVESNINLIPELNSTLSTGLTIKAQLIIPVQNDFLGITKKERGVVRPGNVTINQYVSLKDNFYMNLTAGCFNKNRAGINFDLKKIFREGQIEIGANIGYTGYYSFTGIETEHF